MKIVRAEDVAHVSPKVFFQYIQTTGVGTHKPRNIANASIDHHPRVVWRIVSQDLLLTENFGHCRPGEATLVAVR